MRVSPGVVTQPTGTDFDAVYFRFGATIYARCRQILRDPAAAEDATQEVFMRVHRRLAELPDDRATLAWLYRVATNHCLNELRNGRTHTRIVGDLPPVPAPDAERTIFERDLVFRLAQSLPTDLSAIAWLYHVDGLEQSDIAEIYGVSTRTVIARLRRFTGRARAWIAQEQR